MVANKKTRLAFDHTGCCVSWSSVEHMFDELCLSVSNKFIQTFKRVYSNLQTSFICGFHAQLLSSKSTVESNICLMNFFCARQTSLFKTVGKQVLFEIKATLNFCQQINCRRNFFITTLTLSCFTSNIVRITSLRE